jgi:hypothetical protein
VLTGGKFGTVSSSLLALPRKIQHSVFHYCSGPPSKKTYEDLSALLRQVLSAGRSRRLAEKAAADGQTHDASKSKTPAAAVPQSLAEAAGPVAIEAPSAAEGAASS